MGATEIIHLESIAKGPKKKKKLTTTEEILETFHVSGTVGASEGKAESDEYELHNDYLMILLTVQATKTIAGPFLISSSNLFDFAELTRFNLECVLSILVSIPFWASLNSETRSVQ